MRISLLLLAGIAVGLGQPAVAQAQGSAEDSGGGGLSAPRGPGGGSEADGPDATGEQAPAEAEPSPGGEEETEPAASGNQGDESAPPPKTEAAGAKGRPASEEGQASKEETAAESGKVERHVASEKVVTHEPKPPERDPAHEQRFRAHNTFAGPVGGLRVVDAGSGPVGSFRFQLAGEFFAQDGFLQPDDDHEHFGLTLSFTHTPHRMIEVYASVHSSTTSNDEAPNRTMMKLGDTMAGIKVFGEPLDWLRVGGDVNFTLLSPVSELNFQISGFRLGMRANATADLRRTANEIPLIMRLNLQYLLDQSAELVEGVEQRRREQLVDPASPPFRHLVTPAERYALGVNRVDRFNIGLGFEIPLQLASNFYLHPIAEWNLGTPINRRGFECPFVVDDAMRDEGCAKQSGIVGWPSTVTLGARVLPPVRGLAAFLGVDVGVTGTPDDVVRELAPTAPYTLIFGMSWAYEPQKRPVQVREKIRTVELRQDIPHLGWVRGTVKDADDGSPVPGVRVRFPNRDWSPLVTDDEGRFVTYRAKAGDVELALSRKEYQDGTCTVTIPERGKTGKATCEIEPVRVRVEETKVQLLQKVHFAYDSAEILERSRPLLEDVANALKNNSQIQKVEVQGHTDHTGGSDYNQELSQDRANAVVDRLIEEGVSADRLEPKGYGETKPLVEGETEEARAKNRRVEFVIQERGDG